MTGALKVEYRIPAGRMAAFEAVVERVGRKAAKLGREAMTFTVKGEEPAVVARRRHEDGYVSYSYVPAAEFVPSEGVDEAGATTLFTVEVSGEEPYVSGWRFVASVDHGEGGNVVNVVPGTEAGLVAEWREAGPDCAHCGLNRMRLKTYLLVADDGEVKQVGSTCIGDYFPGMAGDEVARLADLWTVIDTAAADDGEWEGSTGGGSAFNGWLRETVLARAAAVVREVGWLSKAKAAEWDRASTANNVEHALTWRRSSREPTEPFPVTDADVARAAEVIEWVDGLEPTPSDDYLWNLTTAVARPVTTVRLVGLVVSAVGAWERENVKRAEREATNWTEVPDDGARREVTGRVLSVREEPGFRFGSTVSKALLLVETPDGAFKLWGSLPRAIDDAAPGDTVTFTAALKRSDRDVNFGFWSRPSKPALTRAADTNDTNGKAA